MVMGNNNRYGHKVWINILVQEVQAEIEANISMYDKEGEAP